MKKILGVILAIIASVLGFTCTTAFAAESGELPYIIPEGTVYYESSYAFGHGRTGVVEKSNIYTTDPCYAGINGYSFIDQNGRVIESNYVESENDIYIPNAPEGTFMVFLHFHSKYYRNGWVDSKDVKLIDESNIEIQVEENDESENEDIQEPEEIVEEIKEEIQKDVKTAIVVDFSGSMLDNQREVVDLLGTLEFGENVSIMVFADWSEIITHEQLTNEDFYVGGGTALFSALNDVATIDVENVILITDLQATDNFKTKLKESSKIKNVMIYDPDDSFEDDDVQSELSEKWNCPISRTRIG